METSSPPHRIPVYGAALPKERYVFNCYKQSYDYLSPGLLSGKINTVPIRVLVLPTTAARQQTQEWRPGGLSPPGGVPVAAPDAVAAVY